MRFPSWIVILLVLVWVGPMMRWMFGEGNRARRRHRESGRKELDTRFEESLAERDQVIEDLQRRISELESRLDFTERLLAERSQPATTRVAGVGE